MPIPNHQPYRHGHYQLIEINPRFPAWIYLSHGVGRNLPMALLDIASNNTNTQYPDYQSGMLFIRYAEEQIIPMSAFEDIVMQGKREGQHHE